MMKVKVVSEYYMRLTYMCNPFFSKMISLYDYGCCILESETYASCGTTKGQELLRNNT